MSAQSPTVNPLQASRTRKVCAMAVFGASLILYAWTLAPSVTLVDSGELIVAARSLGVAHPPGFPLYVLLAHLATLIPIGNVAVRVNFASALFAALGASVAALVVIEGMIITRRPASAGNRRKRGDRGKRARKTGLTVQSDKESPRSTLEVLGVSCMVSGLMLAFSRTLWGYATIAEVYTLNSLLILMIFLLMFRWRRQFIEAARQKSDAAAPKQEESKSGASLEDRARPNSYSPPARPAVHPLPHGSLYAAAFLFGLALGVHHVTVGLMLPAFAALVFATEDFGFFASKRFIYAALFGFAGLIIVYSYLPLAASRAPIMNWGDPRTFERLWWQVTGKQYQVFLSFSLGTMAGQFVEFIKLAAREFGPWWLPAGPALAIAGLAALFRRDKTIFWFLTLVIAADLAYSCGYDIAEDKDAYYLPAFIAMAIAAGFGVEWFIGMAAAARNNWRPARFVAFGLVLLVPVAALAGNWSYDNRGRYFIAQDYIDNILSTIEPGGMLLTRDWQVYSPTLYFQAIEHRRPDTAVIDVNQLRRSWYFDYLRRVYPATIEQARDQVDAFLEDLRHWEHDPDLYQRDLMLNQRINSRFFEMILAFVTNHIQSAPVYVTLDIAANRDGPDAELTKSLASLYQFVPQVSSSR